MKNIGVKLLLTNWIIWNYKQTKKKQAITNTSNTDKTRQKSDDKNKKPSPSQPLKSPTTARKIGKFMIILIIQYNNNNNDIAMINKQ